MLIRAVRKDDIPSILKINEQQDFKLGNRLYCITEAVAFKDDKVTGYGIVKGMAEAIVLVDLEQPKITRMKAIIALMKQAILGTREKGISQLHVFVKDRNLAELLKKHYNFIESKDIVLVKNLN